MLEEQWWVIDTKYRWLCSPISKQEAPVYEVSPFHKLWCRTKPMKACDFDLEYNKIPGSIFCKLVTKNMQIKGVGKRCSCSVIHFISGENANTPFMISHQWRALKIWQRPNSTISILWFLFPFCTGNAELAIDTSCDLQCYIRANS